VIAATITVNVWQNRDVSNGSALEGHGNTCLLFINTNNLIHEHFIMPEKIRDEQDNKNAGNNINT